MQSYTYGSAEGVQALVEAVPAADNLHCFHLSTSEQYLMAQALEMADVAGKPWAQQYTGFGLEESVHWPPCLLDMELDVHQLIGLIYALAEAFDLGDEFAGSWLSCLGETLGVEWI